MTTQQALEIGTVWEIDGRRYRIVGREGYHDSACLDLQAVSVSRDWPPCGFIEVSALRRDGKFISAGESK